MFSRLLLNIEVSFLNLLPCWQPLTENFAYLLFLQVDVLQLSHLWICESGFSHSDLSAEKIVQTLR